MWLGDWDVVIYFNTLYRWPNLRHFNLNSKFRKVSCLEYYQLNFCWVWPKKCIQNGLCVVPISTMFLGGVLGSVVRIPVWPRFSFHSLKMLSYSTRLKINLVLDSDFVNKCCDEKFQCASRNAVRFLLRTLFGSNAAEVNLIVL